jgi:hypothetical protein
MASGFRQWLTGLLRLAAPAAPLSLADAQKTLGGVPAISLTVGAHDLSAYLWGYTYEEAAEGQQSPGTGAGLTIWLDNRADRFDDLAGDWPDLKRGAAVDLRRGLVLGGTATTAKLPRTWIEGFRYVFVEGAALLRVDCIDWLGKLRRFRYASEQTWNDTEVATIAGSILGEVGLTLEAGSFSFLTDFVVSPRRDLDQALRDLMNRVDESLYAGLDGEIQHKQLDPAEASGYSYDWGLGGGGAGGNHPLLPGTEIAETSPRYNKVAVIGGPAKEYSGSVDDLNEQALVGVRLRTITDRDLTSDAQCEERARAELRTWQAQTVTATIVARPHFTLRMYDVVDVAAPPWGGPSVTGRVRHILEEYGHGQGLWQQTITAGGVAGLGVAAAQIEDGAIGTGHLIEGAVTADEVAAGAVTAGKIDVANLSAISADMGTLTAGVIKMGSGTKDSDLDGFQLDADELVGQENGVDQVSLRASDGRIVAGGGAVVLDSGGIHATSGNADVNKHKIKDGANIIAALFAELQSGTGADATLEAVGKNASNPEAYAEVTARTYDGATHGGVASITISLDTGTGVIDVGGATRMRLGTVYLEMTEQGSDPAAPGTNRGRLFLRDNGSGKTQLCVVFNTGAVQVIATEPS